MNRQKIIDEMLRLAGRYHELKTNEDRIAVRSAYEALKWVLDECMEKPSK